MPMLVMSLSPLFAGLGILGVLLVVSIVGLILVHNHKEHRMPLPDFDDHDARFNELVMKVRQPWQYRAKRITDRLTRDA